MRVGAPCATPHEQVDDQDDIAREASLKHVSHIALRTAQQSLGCQWLGHESIGTTNRYLDFLGTEAHRAGLGRLNRARGNEGAIETPKADTP